MPDAVAGHLTSRVGDRAGIIGLFLCQASRLHELITELIKVKPTKPIALSLVVDTGLGGVPKAVSIVESRTELLALRMVEMPAPSDVDEVWLERVAEFVPEDAVRVIEPRRGGPDWLEGVRRVAEHGYWPKLRCGGLSNEAFPSVDAVADFLSVVTAANGSFKATAGLHNALRHTDPETPTVTSRPACPAGSRIRHAKALTVLWVISHPSRRARWAKAGSGSIARAAGWR